MKMKQIVVLLLSSWLFFLKKKQQPVAPLKMRFPDGTRIEATIVTSEGVCPEVTIRLVGTAYMLLPDISNQINIRLHPVKSRLTWDIQQITPRSVRLRIPPMYLLDLHSTGRELDALWMQTRKESIDLLVDRFYRELVFMLVEQSDEYPMSTSSYYYFEAQKILELCLRSARQMQLSLSDLQAKYLLRNDFAQLMFEPDVKCFIVNVSELFLHFHSRRGLAPCLISRRMTAKQLQELRIKTLSRRNFWARKYTLSEARLSRRNQLDWLATVSQETLVDIIATRDHAKLAWEQADGEFQYLFPGVTPEQQKTHMEQFELLAMLKEA